MPQKEPHIMLDLDGVLVDFVGGVEKVFDVDLSQLNTWNIAEYMRITPQAFWRKIGESRLFWGELKPYPWARDVVNLCLTATKGNVTIVTSPAADPNCAGQKMWWISHWFPTFKRGFLIGPEKHLLAKPHHALVDDSPSNVEAFVRYGGHAITFPQGWNSVSLKEGETHLQYLERELEIFVQRINEGGGL